MTRLIDGDALKHELMKAFNCENATKYGNKDAEQQAHSYSTIMLYEVSDIIEDTIDNAPTVPLPDFKEGYRQAVLDGRTNLSRPKGKWIIDNENEKFICPICKHEIKISRLEYLPAVRWYLKPNFCEECGADMRKE